MRQPSAGFQARLNISVPRRLSTAIHFLNQYTPAPKPEDQQPMEHCPEEEGSSSFNLFCSHPGGNRGDYPLLHLVFYCIDKVKKYKLSPGGQAKADKTDQRLPRTFRSRSMSPRQRAAEERASVSGVRSKTESRRSRTLINRGRWRSARLGRTRRRTRPR